MKKYVLFGAGLNGRETIRVIGKDNIAFFLDNDPGKEHTFIEGIPVHFFGRCNKNLSDYRILITASETYTHEIQRILQDHQITNYITLSHLYQQMEDHQNGNEIETYQRAINWVENHTIQGQGMVASTILKKPYPEVTGYYIPTLLRWGYRELAISYAKWLCEIQKPDGSWYDAEDRSPYVFDSAQILKGLLAIRDIYPDVDEAIKKGCDWIVSNVRSDGRLTTPSVEAWGDESMCSELVHLYCLTPLKDAASKFGILRYGDAADRVLEYYKRNCYKEIVNFQLLSHFYAYVIEGLIDMGETKLARLAMEKIEALQGENGSIPAYHNVSWVCSTGLFQFSVIWFKLGDWERGRKTFEYACGLQNKSGGWFGSYLSSENKNEINTYFPTGEISWATKYFLDALFYKKLGEFNLQADSFLFDISEHDERYQIVKSEIYSTSRSCKTAVLDVGCGKGRYIRKLVEDLPENQYFAVDLSEEVLKQIDDVRIEKKQGSLTNIPYEDSTFDTVYTCEALEHAIDIRSALREMARVAKNGGKLIIIDKNKRELGTLSINEGEQWFDPDILKQELEEYCDNVYVKLDVKYEPMQNEHLFCAWVGRVK